MPKTENNIGRPKNLQNSAKCVNVSQGYIYIYMYGLIGTDKITESNSDDNDSPMLIV